MSGVLYIDGRKLGDVSITNMTLTAEDDNSLSGFSIPKNQEACFYVTNPITRLDFLSIFHGRKVTNNWLKMHGGIMSRKGK